MHHVRHRSFTPEPIGKCCRRQLPRVALVGSRHHTLGIDRLLAKGGVVGPGARTFDKARGSRDRFALHTYDGHDHARPPQK